MGHMVGASHGINGAKSFITICPWLLMMLSMSQSSHRSFTTAWVVLKSMRIQRFWVQVVKLLAVCIVEVKLQVVFMAATVWVVILCSIVWFSDAYLDERLPVTSPLPTLSTSRV